MPKVFPHFLRSVLSLLEFSFQIHHSQLDDIFPFMSFEKSLFAASWDEMGQRPEKGFSCSDLADGKKAWASAP